MFQVDLLKLPFCALDRRGSLRQYGCSDFNRWLGVHGVRAANGLNCVVCSRILLVDSIWTGAIPLDVLEGVMASNR